MCLAWCWLRVTTSEPDWHQCERNLIVASPLLVLRMCFIPFCLLLERPACLTSCVMCDAHLFLEATAYVGVPSRHTRALPTGLFPRGVLPKERLPNHELYRGFLLWSYIMPPTPKAQSNQQQGLPPTQNVKLLFCVTDEKKAHFHLFATTLVLSLVAHPLPC